MVVAVGVAAFDLIACAAAMQAVLRLRHEEQAHGELLLATPVRRSGWLGSHLLLGALAALTTLAGFTVVTGASLAASDDDRLAVLRAHPDLAGKLAAAKRLTADSSAEQASAGLDALTDAERAEFTRLNEAYVARHGFPFIIAVRDHDKAGIMAAMTRRLDNDTGTERSEAERQVARIGELRLKAMLD